LQARELTMTTAMHKHPVHEAVIEEARSFQ
jgi:hypothetical protein